jgi:hypothetical protein
VPSVGVFASPVHSKALRVITAPLVLASALRRDLAGVITVAGVCCARRSSYSGSCCYHRLECSHSTQMLPGFRDTPCAALGAQNECCWCDYYCRYIAALLCKKLLSPLLRVQPQHTYAFGTFATLVVLPLMRDLASATALAGTLLRSALNSFKKLLPPSVQVQPRHTNSPGVFTTLLVLLSALGTSEEALRRELASATPIAGVLLRSALSWYKKLLLPQSGRMQSWHLECPRCVRHTLCAAPGAQRKFCQCERICVHVAALSVQLALQTTVAVGSSVFVLEVYVLDRPLHLSST